MIKIDVNIADDIKGLPLTTGKVAAAAEFVCKEEDISECEIGIIFVTDESIHTINMDYLEHDFPTDVITFVLNDENEPLQGEIYISAETAAEQANEYNVTHEDELLRLVVHGILHLAGHDDHTEEERKRMIELGDSYLIKFYKQNK